MADRDLEAKQVTILDEDLQDRRDEEEKRLKSVLQEVLNNGEGEGKTKEEKV